MMRILRNKRAQTTAEYAVLIAIVVGAVVAMQVYVRRGIQGRIKNVVDHVGTGANVGGSALTLTGEQYEPYYSDSAGSTSRESRGKDLYGKEGKSGKEVSEKTIQARQSVQGWGGSDTATIADVAPATADQLAGQDLEVEDGSK